MRKRQIRTRTQAGTRPQNRRRRQVPYQHRSRRASSRTATPKWKRGLLLIMLIGLGVGGYLYMKYQKPVVMSQLELSEKRQASKSEVKVKTVKKTTPRFEFYKKLPNPQGRRSQPLSTAKKNKSTKPVKAKQHIVQVGSFQHYAEAEQLRAELILLGFDVTIKRTKREGKKWYRLHVGAYPSLLAAAKVKQQLHQQGYQSMLKSV